MMYQNKFIAIVKSEDGKVLREDKDVVYLPFGEHYSLQFKNLNSQKAVISVEIDGQDVLGNKQLIIDAGQSINLERFIDSLDSGNKFKFIQKTKEIQEFRGDKIDDGFIKVTFQYERPTYFNSTFYHPSTVYTKSTNINSTSGDVTNQVLRSSNLSRGIDTSNFSNYAPVDSLTASNSQVTTDGFDSFAPVADEGITVKGAVSSQQFRRGSIGALEVEKHTMILRLKGFSRTGNEVTEALTVTTKLQCSSCGRKFDSTHKFCSSCGTAL